MQVTGSHNNVEIGQTSGTPNYCVGEGNVVAYIDESASPPDAVQDILAGATLDYGALCTCENGIIVHQSISAEVRALFERNGGYFCSTEQTAALRTTLFSSDGTLNRALIAQPAAEIALRAGFEIPPDTRILFVRPEAIGPADPLSGEKLSVIVAFYEVPSFEAGVALINHILEFEGAGHSSILHTNNERQIEQFAREVNVCRAVVNNPARLC